MKRGLFTVFFCLSAGFIFGQAVGDYRSRIGGNWHGPSAWEVFFNGAWRQVHTSAAGPFLNIIPTSSSGVITVRHNINITSSIVLNQTFVQSPAQLRINAGVVLTLADDVSGTSLQINANAVLVNLGTLDLQSQLSSSPCQVFGEIYSTSTILSSNAALLVINGGGRYNHSHASGGAVPSATWNANSMILISGLTSTNPLPPTNLGQPFWNVAWDTPSMGSTSNFSLGGTLTTVNGSLILINTAGKQVRLSSGLPGYNLNIGEDLYVQTGNFVLSENQSSSTSITVGRSLIVVSGSLTLGTANNSPIDILLSGHFIKSGGTFSRGSGTGSGTIHFSGGGQIQTYGNNSTIVSPVNFSVDNGSILQLGTQALTGPGTFTLNSGATLRVGALDALGPIQNSGSAGNIRTTGVRTYQPGSTIVYNGLGTQRMGNGHPSVTNTTIDNVSNVYMVSNVSINGTLSLLNGVLIIDNRTLTIGGGYSATNGYLGVTTLSNLVVNGSGDIDDLQLAPVQSQAPPNAMNNLTINRTAGTVTLGLPLIVGGTLTLSNGSLLIGENFAFSLTLRGPFIQTAGLLSVANNPNFTIEGAGALPANIIFAGTGFETLTMNRTGTFSTVNPLTIDSLNLFNGVVNHPVSNLTMNSNGVVTRRSGGSINQVLGAITNYNVLYDVSTDITTGNELPLVSTQLGNLTKQGAAAVLLNKDIVVNGTFTIATGTFDVGTGNDVTINRNLTVNGTFETQQGLVTFGGNSPQNILGTDTVTFFDVLLNQTANSTLDVATNVDVINSLGITSPSTLNAGNQLVRLLSNATRTAYVPALNASAAIEGTVIAERHLPNNLGERAWRYIAPPVTGTFVSDWKTEMTITGSFSDPATGTGVISSSPSMYIYDEPSGSFNLNNGYQPYPTSGPSTTAPLVNGKGYSVFGRTTGQIVFDSRGRVGQGDRPVAVVNSGIGPESGWNLIGNPYPSPIDWDNVTIPAGVNNAVYIYDNANNANNGVGFVSYVNGVSSPASFQGEIASGQAFFVRATGNATITFQENDKINASPQFYREQGISNLLRITLKGQDKTDETVIRLHEDASDLFDSQYDAYKLPNRSLSLATLIGDNSKLVINSLSKQDCSSTVPLIIEGAESGSYSFNFTGMETFLNSSSLFLFDKLQNKLVDLRSADDYSFTIQESDLNSLKNRFQIQLGKPVKGEPVTIQQDGSTLISNYEEGNEWYLNGVSIGNYNMITIIDSGTYSLKVNINGCTLSSVHQVSFNDLKESSLSNDKMEIYPNPTSGKVIIRVHSQSDLTRVKLISPLGVELNSMDLGGAAIRSGEFDLINYPSGIYMIRIYDGRFFRTKKVSKID